MEKQQTLKNITKWGGFQGVLVGWKKRNKFIQSKVLEAVKYITYVCSLFETRRCSFHARIICELLQVTTSYDYQRQATAPWKCELEMRADAGRRDATGR